MINNTYVYLMTPFLIWRKFSILGVLFIVDRVLRLVVTTGNVNQAQLVKFTCVILEIKKVMSKLRLIRHEFLEMVMT